MTRKKIENMVAIMTSNGIKYNKQFDSVLQRGFSDEAKESFFLEVLTDLDKVLKVGSSAEFTIGIKNAAKELTNIAVKCGEEGSHAMSLEKLRQKKKFCMALVKLPKKPPAKAPEEKPIEVTPPKPASLPTHDCDRCGGTMEQQSNSYWKCKYCGKVADNATAVENTQTMQKMFNQTKRDMINNLRRNLYDAVSAEYISKNDVKNACIELKKYLPDDFRAVFFSIAVGSNMRALTEAIRGIDVNKNKEDLECIIQFLIKSLDTDFLLELNNLNERAFKQQNIQLYGKYATEISETAANVDSGVYATTLPREVFVAYSSKDMHYVSQLVEVLEGQGLQCFVAARNLRHGAGSVENYEKAIAEAIDHCKCFVFVSTVNSRAFGCDALKIELPYVQKHDIENAPPEYRNNYEAIPHKYKKPRVEYMVETSKRTNAADKITNEFFHGYEWVLSPEDVAARVMKQLVETPR